MPEFDLQRMLEGMDGKLDEARERLIKLEGRFDSMESHRADVERRLGKVEDAVDAMQEEKASREAVRTYQRDLTVTRRWLAGFGVSLAAVVLAIVGRMLG